MKIAISFFPSYDSGTDSHSSLSTIIGTHGPKGFHVHLNTNSTELWNLARGIRVISYLLCCRRRDVGIPGLIWMILPSLCHSSFLYQLMNCWMCLRLLDLFKRSRRSYCFCGREYTPYSVANPRQVSWVFGCDMMLNIMPIEIWGDIRQRKQKKKKKTN